MRKPYTAPRLTVVSFKAERGYAMSGSDGGLMHRIQQELEGLVMIESSESGRVSTYTRDDSWGSEGWF